MDIVQVDMLTYFRHEHTQWKVFTRAKVHEF